MILDGDKTVTGATLDELFRRAGVASPDAVALSDSPNRTDFTESAPRRLTYAEADRAISTLAARLLHLGLKTDAVVALQLPNTVEAVVTLLAILRAGMIAAPLPLLWRKQEIVTALQGIAAKAIIACGRAGSERPVNNAMVAAAELFPIRHICAFGSDLPDGIVPLDDIFEPSDELAHAAVRPGPAAAHVAVVTFDVTPAGIVPVARNAVQLMAGGQAVLLEIAMPRGGTILSTIPPSGFAGISLTLMPWLLSGGTLALHHGCDLAALSAQSETLSGATLILPGPALEPIGEAGLLLPFTDVIALWRSPERLASAPAWYRDALLTDVAAFGEVGLLAGKRDANCRPLAIPCGQITAPRSGPNAIPVAQCARTRTGTLSLRGGMVATHPFPPNAQAKTIEFVDTGFTCAIEDDGFVITGPPAGISSIGGYRLAQQAVDALVGEADPGATIMPVPDGVLGQKLAGRSKEPQKLAAVLRERGSNPLITGAFTRSGQAA